MSLIPPSIESLIDEAPQLLAQLIAIPSYSRSEEKVADAFAQIMKDCDFTPSRHGNNLWLIASCFNPDIPTLLLNAHIDTVKPVAAWTRLPHEPVFEDGKLFGLGSNDCGGGLISLFQTFRYLDAAPRSFNLVYLASAEEEVSGKNGIESVLPLLPSIDAAIVGEPTSLQPAIAEKGLMVLDCTAHGRAGHAARNEGDNAIYRALPAIEWLSSFTFPKVSNLLGAVKTSVTMISAGTQHNVVPDQCKFVVDVRSNELYSNEQLYHLIAEQISPVEVQPRSFRLNSSHIECSHPLVEACVRLGLQPFGSPTLSDQALMKFPSLKLGPGESARSHTANEYIELKEIEQAIRLYIELLLPLQL